MQKKSTKSKTPAKSAVPKSAAKARTSSKSHSIRKLEDIPGRIHLQFYGNAPAVKAKDLRVGDTTVWNWGGEEEILSITPSKSGTSLHMEVKTNGKIYQRTCRSDRLIGLSTKSYIDKSAKKK